MFEYLVYAIDVSGDRQISQLLLCMLRAGHITMGFHKFMLVTRGDNTQLDPSCVSAPPATNVDLFACCAERLFKSSLAIDRAGA